jgi:hypothetical protein
VPGQRSRLTGRDQGRTVVGPSAHFGQRGPPDLSHVGDRKGAMYRRARRRDRARSTSNAEAEAHEPACGLLLGRFTVSQGMMTTPRVAPIPTNRLHGAGGRRGSQDAVAVMPASPMMATTIVVLARSATRCPNRDREMFCRGAA